MLFCRHFLLCLIHHQITFIMAANQAALNNYLQDTLGFPEDLSRALNAQGLDSFDTLATLTDKDVKEVCSNVRKPGGTIPNPVFDAENPVAGVPATIPNPGVSMGLPREKLLRQLCYYCVHLHKIQREFTAQGANLAKLTELWRFKEAIEEQDDDDIKFPEALKTVENVRQTLEDIDDYLNRKRGTDGALLAYVTRESVTIPAGAPDYGEPSFDAEMIQRARHSGNAFQQDNRLVRTMLRTVFHGGPGWNWISSFSRSNNGRAAYLAIKSHYLGEAFQSRIRAAADKVLDGTFFDGKARTFTFERYCERLNNAFTDLEQSGETVDTEQKIRIFLRGIIDPTLEAAKNQVLATTALRETFESAVNYVAQFADRKASLDTNRSRNLSSIQMQRGRNADVAGRGRGRGGRFGPGRGRSNGRLANRVARAQNRSTNTITDRYYSPEEWNRLSPEDQQRVRDLRTQRDRARGMSAVATFNDRNVRPRIDQAETPPPAQVDNDTTTIASNLSGSGLGDRMSQRRNR
jgi:hypothetical protein